MLSKHLIPLFMLLSTPAFSKGYVQGMDRFAVLYEYQVPALKAGEHADIWLPIASSDAFQHVEAVVTAEGLQTQEGKDPDFGNTILHTTADASQAGRKVQVAYTVTRLEQPAYAAGDEERNPLYLRAEPLVPLNERFKKLAAQITRGKTTDLDKGRAIYDYVFKEMKYDKSGNGWGRGDATYACDVKTGNCTDFHALFIALARASGIPTRFAIGFTIPPQGTSGKIEGYHCWAEFAADGRWIPIDISEGWKEPESKDYYFGHHPANRFQLSQGRDFPLVPAAKAGHANFLVHPYVEINGKPIRATTGTYSYKREAEQAAKS